MPINFPEILCCQISKVGYNEAKMGYKMLCFPCLFASDAYDKMGYKVMKTKLFTNFLLPRQRGKLPILGN